MRSGAWIPALVLALFAAAAARAEHVFQEGVPYYFDQFDASTKPWQPGQDLNIEEVFKNYQYFEIHFENGGRELRVDRYVRNRKQESSRYRIGSGGGLEKLER